jgi:protein TonB
VAASTLSSFRLPIAFVLGVIIATALFWFLWLLTGADLEFTEVKQAVKIEFTRLRQDTEVQARERAKVERQETPKAPPAPDVGRVSLDPSASSVTMIQPSVDTKASLRGAITMGAGSDRDVIPLVRINPEYPMRARQRGVEGWVLIQFTISPAGTVKDARVVDADPPNIFDDSAIKAVNRWRYNPKIEEGVAVERRGVQVVLEFKLEG